MKPRAHYAYHPACPAFLYSLTSAVSEYKNAENAEYALLNLSGAPAQNFIFEMGNVCEGCEPSCNQPTPWPTKTKNSELDTPRGYTFSPTKSLESITTFDFARFDPDLRTMIKELIRTNKPVCQKHRILRATRRLHWPKAGSIVMISTIRGPFCENFWHFSCLFSAGGWFVSYTDTHHTNSECRVRCPAGRARLRHSELRQSAATPFVSVTCLSREPVPRSR